MLISTWSDKGGTGKTTLAILAAGYFGARVLDLDPQGDLARWAEKTGRACERLGSDAAKRLVQAATDEAFWVVDCPPGTHPEAVQGMAYSRLVVIPTRSGDADLVALARALDTVRIVQSNGNPDLQVGVVLNAIRDTGRSRGVSQGLRVSSGYSYLGEIKERLAYEEAYSRGTTVVGEGGAAAAEAEAVMTRLKALLPPPPALRKNVKAVNQRSAGA